MKNYEIYFISTLNDTKNRVFVVWYHNYWQSIVQFESLSCSVLATMSWMLYWRLIFLVVALIFVKWIPSYCHWIKFQTLFLSLYWIGCHSVGLYLYLTLHWNFYYGSDNCCFSNLKRSFLLVFSVFFLLIFALQDKILC